MIAIRAGIVRPFRQRYGDYRPAKRRRSPDRSSLLRGRRREAAEIKKRPECEEELVADRKRSKRGRVRGTRGKARPVNGREKATTGPPSQQATGRPRGRPPGSVALTNEVEGTVINFIRAGAFDYVAAQAAGISARTFREWIQRGEGRHPTKRPTARLRRFAERVAQAKAEARLDAEVLVHRDSPMYWLTRAARSKPDKEGWSEPARGSDGSPVGGGLDGVGPEDSFELNRVITELLVGG